ncbi:MAG: alpha/beta hydrolase [Eubacteriales bacterium]|nr:alpha/beta hydrolase [Eubacteriales bacterium]
MDFQEFGTEHEKTLLLLPGTAIPWQINFKNVVDEWAKKYHLICVNYDGFEGDKTKIFTDVPTVTAKIEDYLLKNHGGRVDGAYGSSLGGSFAGLLVQRRRVHIDHAFIGSSDLDQGSPIAARLMTALVSPMLSGACTSEAKRQKLKRKLAKRGAIGDNAGSMAFADAFIDGMANLHPRTIARQFYSDYVTPLDEHIAVDGTTIHVIYALKMGKKYGARYRRHFENPDIHEFDMKHEIWLYDEAWKPEVMAVIDTCMGEQTK